MTVPAAGTGANVVEVMSTGAVLRMQIQSIKDMLGTPLPKSKAEVLLLDAKMAGWQSDVQRYNEKSTDYRKTCFDAVRRANRDTIVNQATTCMRGDLLLHISFLRKQQAYVASLPLITAATRSGALLSVNNLISAEMTIVDAIDAHLYTSIAILNDTKAKLRDHYRLPYWLSLTAIRAERQLTFLGLMLKRIEEIVAENNNTPLIEKTTLQALRCMKETVGAYQLVTTATGSSAASKSFSEATKLLGPCKDAIWNVGHLKNRQQSASTGSTVLQTDAEKSQ